MKTARSLILGSASGLLALSGAQAADLPVKTKAIEYVKICTAYGAGFFYIPGTDTCIKIGGYVRADTTFNGGAHGAPAWNGDFGQDNRYRDYYTARTRMANGVTGSIGLDDPTVWDRTNVYNLALPLNATFNTGNAYGGTHSPDVVGNIRVDQAWGLFQISGAACQGDA